MLTTTTATAAGKSVGAFVAEKAVDLDQLEEFLNEDQNRYQSLEARSGKDRDPAWPRGKENEERQSVVANPVDTGGRERQQHEHFEYEHAPDHPIEPEPSGLDGRVCPDQRHDDGGDCQQRGNGGGRDEPLLGALGTSGSTLIFGGLHEAQFAPLTGGRSR